MLEWMILTKKRDGSGFVFYGSELDCKAHEKAAINRKEDIEIAPTQIQRKDKKLAQENVREENEENDNDTSRNFTIGRKNGTRKR